MPKIKITRYKGTSDTGTGKKKTLQVTLANKKGATTLTRSVTKDAGKKTTERSVVRNLRQGTTVKKTKEDGVKTKTYRADADRSGGKIYNGTDRKMFKAANKLNKVIEKRGRAADLQNAAMEGAKMGMAKKAGHADAVRGGRRNAIKLNEARTEFMNHPYKYDAAKVKKAMESGRGGKVQRVMRRDLKSGRAF